MKNDWLTAYATRQLIADRRDAWDVQAIEQIENAIIDYARTVLPARCQFMWDKTLVDGRPDYKVEHRDAPVPTWVWDLTMDLSMDWRTGIFHLAGDHEDQLRYVKLVGLEFNRDAVERIWPDTNKEKFAFVEGSAGGSVDADGTSVSKAKSGRKRSQQWNDWVAYLAVAANDIVRQEGPEALMDKVADLMAQDGREAMPRSTVQPAAQAVIALFERKKL